MKVDGTHYRTIWAAQDGSPRVEIIDQRQLPHRFVTVTLEDVEAAYRAIKDKSEKGVKKGSEKGSGLTF